LILTKAKEDRLKSPNSTRYRPGFGDSLSEELSESLSMKKEELERSVKDLVRGWLDFANYSVPT